MKMVQDSAIYLIGELISRAMPFLLLPYLSRKLGVEGFGLLAYYQTYLVLLFIIISLSQEGAITRYFYRYGKRSLLLAIHTGYGYSIITGGIILIGCTLLQSEILIYLTLSALFQSFLGVQLSIRQCQKQPIPYAILQFSSSLSSVVFTILLLELFYTDLVEKRILAILFSNLFVFIIGYILSNKKIKYKHFKWQNYKTALIYLLGFGLPLILHNVSLFLKGQIDRIFIYHQFEQADLGLYAMGAQISAILMIVLQALNKATLPYFFDGLKQKKISLHTIHKWAFFSLLIVPIPALIMLLIPDNFISWILGTQFQGAKYYAILFLISTTLIIPYFILVNYLFYYGKNKLISICSLFSTLFYLVSLIGLTFTEIKYMPYASIIGSLAILPILYLITNKVGKTV